MSDFQTKDGCYFINKQVMEEIKKVDEKVDDLKLEVAKIPQAVSEKLDEKLNRFVTKDAFEPVKKIAYGMVGVVLTTVVLAILALVLKN